MVKKKKVTIKDINEIPKSDLDKVPTMMIAGEREIALDFATKVYKKFEQTVKAIILFGSSAKKEATLDSDIDIIIIIDDVSIIWDEELIATYREELGKIIQTNPYRKALHVNSVKLSTWWQDLMMGDPVVMNVLRYGDALIDHGGFFIPQKALLQAGKIKSTPEAIYNLLQRVPMHLSRARSSLLGVIDGLYWACVDSAHAAIIAANIPAPSPEQIEQIMRDNFVKKNICRGSYADFYGEIFALSKEVVYGKLTDISGKKLDDLKTKTDDFVREMSKIVKEITSEK